MPLVLFVAFIIVPLIELVVIAQVGGVIGFWPTIILLVVDSLIGAYLVRREGRRAWDAFRAALSEMRWPGDEVAQGALVLVGGALLLTPGFVTDVAGLAMVLPLTRAGLSRVLRRRLTPPQVRTFQATREQVRRDPEPGRGAGESSTSRQGGRVMDVEVVSVERDDPPGVGAGGDDEPA